jgi:hypothetical protein
MKQIKRFSLLLILPFLTLPCVSLPSYAQTWTVSSGIPFSADDLAREVAAAGGTPKDTDILVYGYTPVTERYALCADESLSVSIKEGELRALVKTVRNGSLVKADFVVGKGMDGSAMLTSLAASIARLGSK